MELIKEITGAVGGLLSDPAKEQMTSASDRVGGNMSTNAASASQAVTKTKYGFYPAKKNYDHFFSQSTKRNAANTNPNKMVELKSGDWSDSNGEFHELLKIELPKDFYTETSKPAHGPTRPWASIRTSFSFELQANVVTGACGSLIMIYVPPGVDLTTRDAKAYRMFPSVELNAGTDTTAKLYIPYTHYTNYVGTDTADLGAIHVFVWCPLTVPANTAGTVTVTLMGSLDELDLQCPRPQGRVKRDIAEGPGAMNLANCKSTRGAQSVALAGESVAVDPTTSGSSRAVRSIKPLVQVYCPFLIGGGVTNAWNVSSTKGTALTKANLQLNAASEIFKFFSNGYCYWRGSLVLRLTVFNSTLHKGRLRLAFFPSSDGTAPTDYTMAQSDNALYKIMDIGLNPSIELVIPFQNNSWLRDVNDPFGRVAIFVASRLSASTNCAPNVRYMLEIKAGEDFELCVPRTGGVNYQAHDDDNDMTSWGDQVDLAEQRGELDTETTGVEASTTMAAAAAGITADSQQQDKPGAPLKKPVPAKFLNAIIKDINVTHCDHMKLQILLGRAQFMGNLTRDASALFTFDLVVPENGFFSFLKAFAYWNGDLTIHVINESRGHTRFAHTYRTGKVSNPTSSTLSTLGEIIVPPQQSISFTVPFYWDTPARRVNDPKTLGVLIIETAAAAKLSIFLSFKTISLFTPVPVPKVATLRSFLMANKDVNRQHPEHNVLLKLASEGRWDEELENLERFRMKRLPSTYSHLHKQMCESDDDLDDSDSDTKPKKCPFKTCVNEKPVPKKTEDSFEKDLTTEGIEPNPGPPASLVYLNRGLYKHYGVRVGDSVIHMNSENILEAASIGKVKMTRTPYTSDWQIEEEIDIDDLMAQAIEDSVGREEIFTGSNNCETVAREALNIPGMTQSRALAIFGIIVCAATSATLAGGEIMAETGEGIFEKTREAATKAWRTVTKFFTEELLSGIKCEVVKTVMKMLVRVVCYGILFCSSPNLLTGAAVGTLIVMDLASVEGLSGCVRDLCHALLDGDLVGCAESITEIMHKNSKDRSAFVTESVNQVVDFVKEAFPQKKVIDDSDDDSSAYAEAGDPFRHFNSGTSAAKNFGWWMQKLEQFWTWLKRFFSPDQAAKCSDWLEEHTDLVANILANADAIIIESRDPKNTRNSKWQRKVTMALKELAALKHLALKAQNPDIVTQCAAMLGRMTRVPKPKSYCDDMFRMEPIGIWVTGPAGCGKSAFATNLMLQFRQELLDRGVPIPDNGVFTQPSQCEFMDNYNGQWIHIIDDLAQSRDEEDVRFMCQMVSSIPYTVNMADLSEKGTQYTSEVVLATTNRRDFNSSVIWDPRALERRFQFKWQLQTNPSYKSEDGTLDMAKARKARADETGDAWTIASGLENSTFRPCVMKVLVRMLCDTYEHKMRVFQQMREQVAPLRGKERPDLKDVDWGTIIEPLFQKPAPEIESGGPEPTVTYTSDKYDDDKLIEEAFVTLCPVDSDSPFLFGKKTDRSIERVTASEAVKDWVKKTFKKMKKWWQDHKEWIKGIAIFTTVVGTVLSAYTIYAVLKKDGNPYKVVRQPADLGPLEPERAYNGFMKQITKKPLVNRAVVKAQGGTGHLGEFAHLFRCGVTLYCNGVECYGLAIGPHRVITYKHGLLTGGYSIERLVWSGLTYIPEDESYTVTVVDLEKDGEEYDSDYIIIDFAKLPFQLKSGLKYMAQHAQGVNGYILTPHSTGNIVVPFRNLVNNDCYAVRYGAEEKKIHINGVIYEAQTFKGMCGSLIVQNIKGAWRIVAMHHAGDKKYYGYGFRIQLPDETPAAEGLVVSKRPAPSTHYTPTKSKIQPSPLHDIIDVHMAPAALTPHDLRLEVDVPNLVKFCSEKYRVDVYQPDDELIEIICAHWKKRLFSATGRCGIITLEEALGGDGANPIDMKTSPGKKYTDRGMRKEDLFKKNPDGSWWVNSKFRQDVYSLYADLAEGKGDVTFCATLKDELRPIDKVKAGKTRCIEAGSVDFVMVFRMLFGRLYRRIYESEPLQTGIAVGINPYIDFHQIYHTLGDNWFALDYCKFDGSLSEKLMRKATEIMCAPLVNPELGMRVMEPVIKSQHWVHDEIWEVAGGMPSGAPCTSVLNSLCNLIVTTYAMLKCGQSGLDSFHIVTYGDDVLGSADPGINGNAVIACIKETFGMEATAPDKTSTDIFIDPNDATFLKRYFRCFPGTRYVTGVLDFDHMMQRIMWCHSHETFKEQMESFLIELMLHGRPNYEAFRILCAERLDRYKIYIPTFEEQYALVRKLFFE